MCVRTASKISPAMPISTSENVNRFSYVTYCIRTTPISEGEIATAYRVWLLPYAVKYTA